MSENIVSVRSKPIPQKCLFKYRIGGYREIYAKWIKAGIGTKWVLGYNALALFIIKNFSPTLLITPCYQTPADFSYFQMIATTAPTVHMMEPTNVPLEGTSLKKKYAQMAANTTSKAKYINAGTHILLEKILVP